MLNIPTVDVPPCTVAVALQNERDTQYREVEVNPRLFSYEYYTLECVRAWLLGTHRQSGAASARTCILVLTRSSG